MSYPLSSLKVLDFSTLLPGPYATMLLADLGAEVLRIEAPNRHDIVKQMPPYDGGISTAFSYLTRGKSNLELDLKSDASKSRIKELVKEFDIVIEQFRPGVMDRLGIGYDILKTINPKLIYCAITGYGQFGPFKDRAGHDINYLSIAGVSSHCGRLDSGPPPMGIQIADIAGGSHHAVMGILAAVIERQRTKKGKFIDISMTDAAFALNAMSGSSCLAGGQEQRPESTLLNGGSFYDYYLTKDGRWLSVGSLEPKFFNCLCDSLDLQGIKQFSQSQNPEHWKQIKNAIEEKIRSKTLSQWEEVFKHQDACVEPVLTISEAAEHPQIKARGMVISVNRGDGKYQLQIGNPIKYKD
ncbi:CaiB/BaiF CoA-transferase family protein [Marinobacter salarius]|uniref:CaiB/BaiF CoA transferase family protein n=1 Tax=Marinobacter salarius TaxID=1420917 RepID=UPI00273A8CBA|nr:CaiB/BaiF CoA-transferase family protein [Marinobacter salarius]MDP4532888.1 CaiB/BaiF CoA-transferase family protein [Marinobacter salarius]